MRFPFPRPRRAALSCLLALPVALAGCGLMRTPYERPAVQGPASWAYGPAQDVAAAGGTWWRHFDDPTLTRLIDQALERNNDLAAAALRVRQAQLRAGLARSDQFPTLGGSVDLSRQRDLYGDRAILRNNSASLTVSYELDLWDRLQAQRDAAEWEAAATEQDRASAALSLVGTTATLYWQVGFINQRLESAAQSIAYAQRTLELVQAQYDAGGASSLEVAEARQNLASQQAARTLMVQQRVETLNALAILFDGPPERVMADPPRLPPTTLPAVPAGVPADLLARRPDLRAAELRLRQALAQTDATRASFYPPITLTGALGSASTALGNLLQNPVGTLGAGLTLPFLNWNQMRLTIQVSETEYALRVVQFRQALYQAMADVENALSARTQLAAQGELLEQSLAAAQQAEDMYEIRYRSGAVSLRFWLDAQEKRRTAEIERDQNTLDRLLNQVKLYQALGGDTR
ncbi:efflux transporter outer membrane subunit [Bordetella genomosp. 4]|uniref:efflux transporter outer membrane subunit n=1 Tax=Bordetella genomosp. 4 TaxID=463044 RepID=UPI000B9ED89A|nr:efflux transporter outer membrane subunit [Bordetella genomosp. 4]OZI43149.1 RND transporter [Bordetella genomosp. 4]